MRRYRNRKAHIFCNTMLLFAIIIAILLIVIFKQLNKHIKEICEYKGKETVNSIIVETMSQILEGSDEDYINIIRDNNKIVSIETNTTAINRIQNDLKASINKKLSRVSNNNVSLPIGTLTGITLFSGFGPDVVLKLHQIGAVETEIKSEFISQGINQTKFKLFVEVTVELSAILPAHSTKITVQDDYLIAETIIVGQIPETCINLNKI